MAKRFIKIKRSDNPEHVKVAARVLGGKVEMVIDTKTGKKFKAIVSGE